MSAEGRRRLRALLERIGARIDVIERRVEGVERVAFGIDELETRVAQLERRSTLKRELRDQRAEVVLRARAEGFSLRQIARTVGVSEGGVRGILAREGDPSPRLPGGRRLDDFNGAGVSSNGARRAGR